ncbi:MAG: NAD(P)H-dependent flavin oxidoreductase [Acidimicrobiales bacterium]
MQTSTCNMLGIEYPIFAFSHQRDVVAAVSKAGGLGVLGAVALAPDALDVELTWLEEQLGDTPYGIDVIVPAHYVGDDQGGLEAKDLEAFIPQEQRAFVKDLLERYGVPELPAGREAKTGLLSWSAKGAASLLDIALRHKPRLIANALGAPPPDMVKRAHDGGLLVAALAGRPEHALKHKQAGVDIVVAQGYEAGGHTGEVSTMVLVPQVVDAVFPTPVLAAGGIASGRQMAAAMALGAEGVWTGSVWLTTEEAETHPVVKEKFLAATSYDTVRSRSLTGKPARQLKSAWNQSWDSAGSPGPLGMPLQTMLVSEAQLRITRSAATSAGARDLITYFVGQVVGQLNQVKPARRVLLDMVEEYADALQRMAEQLS